MHDSFQKIQYWLICFFLTRAVYLSICLSVCLYIRLSVFNSTQLNKPMDNKVFSVCFCFFAPLLYVQTLRKLFLRLDFLSFSFPPSCTNSLCPPSKYWSQMSNPSIFQIARMTSHWYCHFTLHAYLKNTSILLLLSLK